MKLNKNFGIVLLSGLLLSGIGFVAQETDFFKPTIVQADTASELVISAESKSIPYGSTFNPLDEVVKSTINGVYVQPAISIFEGTDVTGNKISSVDTTKSGKYLIQYVLVVDGGNTVHVKRLALTVLDSTNPPTPTNTAPVISGANDITIELGSKFDSKAGVTASDKEDGDLTAKISIYGLVDLDSSGATNKAGVYTLEYSVKDSGGLTTTVTRKVTVKEKTDPSIPTPPSSGGNGGSGTTTPPSTGGGTGSGSQGGGSGTTTTTPPASTGGGTTTATDSGNKIPDTNTAKSPFAKTGVDGVSVIPAIFAGLGSLFLAAFGLRKKFQK